MVGTKGYEIPVCPKMHALAKMANVRQNLSKNSNEMAKVRFESGYFDENGDFDKMANSRQNLTNVPMTWQRDPSESGYFGKNGIFGENMAKFAKP